MRRRCQFFLCCGSDHLAPSECFSWRAWGPAFHWGGASGPSGAAGRQAALEHNDRRGGLSAGWPPHETHCGGAHTHDSLAIRSTLTHTCQVMRLHTQTHTHMRTRQQTPKPAVLQTQTQNTHTHTHTSKHTHTHTCNTPASAKILWRTTTKTQDW